MEKCVIKCEKIAERLMIEYIKSFEIIGLKYDENNNFNNLLKINIIPIDYDKIPIVNGLKIYINTEQLSVEKYKNLIVQEIKNFSNRKLIIFDYSITNLIIINKLIANDWNLPKIRLYYLPYLYNHFEINRLKDLINNTPKEYQIGIISVKGKRRFKVYQILQRYGFKVNIINKFGEERDIEMAKCKCLLNIHYDHDYKIFEEIRCIRWWFSGLPIISECCDYMEELDIFPYIIWTNYSDILQTVFNYFHNNNFFIKTDNFIINKIAEKRLEQAINSINDFVLDNDDEIK